VTEPGPPRWDPTFRKNEKLPFAKDNLYISTQRGKTPEKLMEAMELPDLKLLYS
jgi:hypothetical protein